MKKRTLALLTALFLIFSLLTACGGKNDPPPSDPVPVEKEDPAPAPSNPVPAVSPDEPDAAQPEAPAPAETDPGEEPLDEETPGEEPPVEEELAPVGPEPAPEPAPEPEPEPEPAPAEEPEGESVMAGSTYTISVTLEGGTGRATVESPAKIRYSENHICWATIVWSSPNFDYMKVDGQKYELISEPGANSAFEIPVSAFDQPLPVIADTIAMSEPHEVEYTLTFDSASMQDA